MQSAEKKKKISEKRRKAKGVGEGFKLWIEFDCYFHSVFLFPHSLPSPHGCILHTESSSTCRRKRL